MTGSNPIPRQPTFARAPALPALALPLPVAYVPFPSSRLPDTRQSCPSSHRAGSSAPANRRIRRIGLPLPLGRAIRPESPVSGCDFGILADKGHVFRAVLGKLLAGFRAIHVGNVKHGQVSASPRNHTLVTRGSGAIATGGEKNARPQLVFDVAARWGNGNRSYRLCPRGSRSYAQGCGRSLATNAPTSGRPYRPGVRYVFSWC